jgi:UDPglucose 6-dehydrogenase
MPAASAEMAKHALNAFLATSISFINDIADACERSGADVLDVIKALRSDPRIGQKAALGPGMGFSGGTLGRDLKALMQFSAEHQFQMPVITASFHKNRQRPDVALEKIIGALGVSGGANGLRGKTVGMFGLTYKPGTRTLRRSRALEMAAELSNRGVALRLHDPAVIEAELPHFENAVFHRDPYQAAAGAHAIAFITPCLEFRDIDFPKLLAAMGPNPILFDAGNLLHDRKEEIEKLGARYFGTGR